MNLDYGGSSRVSSLCESVSKSTGAIARALSWNRGGESVTYSVPCLTRTLWLFWPAQNKRHSKQNLVQMQ